jgi:hypothetical protein
MTRHGRGEIVGASVLMLKGQNSREVVADVKAKLAEMAPHLPEGVHVDPYYDRAQFIDRVLTTIAKNLYLGPNGHPHFAAVGGGSRAAPPYTGGMRNHRSRSGFSRSARSAVRRRRLGEARIACD